MHAIRTARLAVVLSAAALTTVAAPAMAAPPHGDGGHTHHVITGTGDCRDIDAVRFHAVDRGLHQGASQSGIDHGPWHGSC